MGNEQKLIELQRDTVLTGYKLLILNNVEIVTFSTNCTTTPEIAQFDLETVRYYVYFIEE